MPSPFPGMDPFIEGQRWEDFHPSIIASIRDQLVAALRPRYVVDIEERVYVERQPEGHRYIKPDLTVADAELVRMGSQGTSTAVAPSPRLVTVPVAEEMKEYFLALRAVGSLDVVAVIEVLSPTNKRRGSDGHQEYLRKRTTVLDSQTHLIEIDLLRGGERMPAYPPLVGADYCVLVSRRRRRPDAEVWDWMLRQAIPSIPVPLDETEADALLDLQAAFTEAYDRAGYDYKLSYSQPVLPPLREDDAAWATELVARQARQRS